MSGFAIVLLLVMVVAVGSETVLQFLGVVLVKYFLVIWHEMMVCRMAWAACRQLHCSSWS